MGSVNRGVHGDIDEDAAAAAGAPPTMARDAHAAADPAAADTATAYPATDTAAAPPTDTAAAPPTPMLALPAPEDITSLMTLNCATGEPVVLDHFGPVVVNSDGTLSRITNWERMDEREREVAKRRIAKRNIERLRGFRDRGELKDDLVKALDETPD